MTPLVEPLSIDEAFLDVRGARRLWGSPGEIARMLRQRVLDETGLTCSIGVAATKHVAKMASTISKPDGAADRRRGRYRGLPRTAARCVRCGASGPSPRKSLEARGIHTVADVLDTPRAVLDRALGAAMGDRIWHLARGVDARRVDTTRVEKSVGHEETFHRDIDDPAVLRSEFRRLADRVGARLRTHGWEARTIAIKVRFADFTTISRSQTLPEPTAVGQRIGDAALELFGAVERTTAGAAGRRASREAAPVRPGRTDAVGRRCRVAARRGRARRRDRAVRPRRGDARDAARRGARRRHAALASRSRRAMD